MRSQVIIGLVLAFGVGIIFGVLATMGSLYILHRDDPHRDEHFAYAETAPPTITVADEPQVRELALQPGMRVISIAVLDESAGFMLPGTRVDLLAVRTKPDDSVGVHVVVENAQVVAIQQIIADKGKDPGIMISLEVTPEQAKAIVEAQAVGKVRAVLRAPDKAKLLDAVKGNEP